MLSRVWGEIKKFVKDEDGLTTGEWVLLGSAIAVLAIGVAAILVPKIKTMATNTGTTIEGYDPADPAAE